MHAGVGILSDQGGEGHEGRQVSVGFSAVRRWNDAIEVSGIRLVDSAGGSAAELGSHSVSLKTLQITVGMGLWF